VFTNCFAVTFEGFCVVGGEDQGARLGDFVFRKEHFPVGGYGGGVPMRSTLEFLGVPFQVIVDDYVGVRASVSKGVDTGSSEWGHGP
jgi:hypothetical protein